MIKRIIDKKIQSLTTNDIKDFALKNGVSLTEKEVTIIFEFIQKNPKLIYEDLSSILTTIAKEAPLSLYQKVKPTVIEYYQKYHSYL